MSAWRSTSVSTRTLTNCLTCSKRYRVRAEVTHMSRRGFSSSSQTTTTFPTSSTANCGLWSLLRLPKNWQNWHGFATSAEPRLTSILGFWNDKKWSGLVSTPKWLTAMLISGFYFTNLYATPHTIHPMYATMIGSVVRAKNTQ